MSARSFVTTAVCQPVRAAALLAPDKYAMSATTMPGHQPRWERHQRRLGRSKPPSETLAGVTQLTSGNKVTEGCRVGSHSRNVCFL